MRLLFDPEPTPGGAAPSPAPAPPPQPSAPPGPTTPAPAAPPPVPLPADEVSRLYGIAREFESWKAEKQAAIEAETLRASKALAAKGDVERAFDDYKAAQDTRYATLQTALVNRERALVISQALAGAPFVNDQVAADVRQLLELRVEAAMGPDGNPVVRDRQTGRPAADTLREWLASPAAAPYLKAATTGGAGATGGHVPGPAQPAAADPFAALGTPEQRQQGHYAAFGLAPRPRP